MKRNNELNTLKLLTWAAFCLKRVSDKIVSHFFAGSVFVSSTSKDA